MRIISGTHRGAKLYTLEGNEITRPTLDRVKESLFSILINDLENADVLDLFSGSGAIAFESISRGAKSAVLCDNSRKAVGIINQNAKKLKMENQIEILNMDYKKSLEFLKERRFNIIFLDPPYKSDFDIQAVEIIKGYGLLEEDGIIVIETDSEEKIKQLEELDINILKIRKYGRVKLIFLN